MSRRRARTTGELGEHRVFGDEDAAQIHADLTELRLLVADLGAQVSAQFTSIAAHAEIAREQIDLARSEARSDMERTRDTLIGLIETVRSESRGSHHHTGTAPGASLASTDERVKSVEAALDIVRTSLDDAILRQHRMGETMAAFIDTMLAESPGEPVAGLTLP